jgi:hypothetical protein
MHVHHKRMTGEMASPVRDPPQTAGLSQGKPLHHAVLYDESQSGSNIRQWLRI